MAEQSTDRTETDREERETATPPEARETGGEAHESGGEAQELPEQGREWSDTAQEPLGEAQDLSGQAQEPSDETQGLSGEVLEPSEVERLQAELDAAREEARRYQDDYIRKAAETENYKKRVDRGKLDAIRDAKADLVRDLLPVIDDLERAARHSPADGNPEPLLDGIHLVLKGCLEALQKHGVTQVTAQGQPFDPEKHHAYAQVETAEYEPNTVVDEVHRGYYLADRLLRPSLVSVAKAPALRENDETTVESDPTDD